MRRDDQGRPVQRYTIGNDSVLTERDRADVQSVVDSWVAGWAATASVRLVDEHTISVEVAGDLTGDQRDRLSKEIWREAERIESEHL